MCGKCSPDEYNGSPYAVFVDAGLCDDGKYHLEHWAIFYPPHIVNRNHNNTVGRYETREDAEYDIKRLGHLVKRDQQ